MADELARVQQYEYRQVSNFQFSIKHLINTFQNSNLVLQVDYNLVDRRGQHEPTGEVMALNPDNLRGARMGDRYQRSNVPRDKPARKSAKDGNSKKFRPMLDTSDFTGDYKPRTQETKNAFEIILSFIQEAIGDQVSLLFNRVSFK